MGEHDKDDIATVFALRPNLALVMCAHPIGWFDLYHVPLCCDTQPYVNGWFDARRDYLAEQMGEE